MTVNDQQHNILLLVHDAIDRTLELDERQAKETFRRALERITDLEHAIRHEQRRDSEHWAVLEVQREDLVELKTLITRYVHEVDAEAQELWIKTISEHVTQQELRDSHYRR